MKINLMDIKDEEDKQIPEKVRDVYFEISELFFKHDITIKEGLLVNHLMLVPLLCHVKENFHYDHGFSFNGLQMDITTMVKITELEKGKD